MSRFLRAKIRATACLLVHIGVKRNMKLESLIETGNLLFENVERPMHFQNIADGDPEAIDHDASLQKIIGRQLSLQDVGNLGYTPITQLTPEGMQYFFPSLVKLALDLELKDLEGVEQYLFSFIIQIMDGPTDERFSLFTLRQREYVNKVIEFIEKNYMIFVKEECFDEDFYQTKAVWLDGIA